MSHKMITNDSVNVCKKINPSLSVFDLVKKYQQIIHYNALELC